MYRKFPRQNRTQWFSDTHKVWVYGSRSDGGWFVLGSLPFRCGEVYLRDVFIRPTPYIDYCLR